MSLEIYHRNAGQFKEMLDRSGVKVVKAEVPLAEMFGYVNNLRSMTQGRASYSMEFGQYAEVPKMSRRILSKGRNK